MSTSPEFIDFLHEVLQPLGPIQAKRMFGGHGLYHDGQMFGLVVANRLYLKTDAHSLPFFEALHLGPFTFTMKGRPVRLSYHLAPETMLDDPDQARVWALRAWEAAARARSSKILQAERARARRRPRSDT